MRRFFFLLFLIVVLYGTHGRASEVLYPGGVDRKKVGVVIVVDSCTFAKVRQTLEKYRKVLGRDNLETCYLITDMGTTPQEIKESLVDLYENSKLEGAVFIGKIPVPMIRGAQHLTSAFKMDERKYGLRRSSVPSDCYYTDFDLKFRFIRRDSLQPELFYYELASELPQTVEKEIYSGRIKPFSTGEEFYRDIERYLEKVVAAKQQVAPIDSIMVFTGHGYHSESLISWANEYLMLKEQFPDLFNHPGGVCFLYHNMFPEMKDEVLRYLSMDGLDVAIFHAHGGRDVQYLFGLSEGKSPGDKVDYLKKFLRNKLRDAKRRGRSLSDVKNYYIRAYGIPESWFEGAFDDSLIRNDSIAEAMLDIYIDDLKHMEPEPRLMILDQCFTGDFTSPEYIAGEYLFGKGGTVVVVANSVNVKQDIWADEYLGLLQHGIRIGLIHRMNSFIESHILGDPTFAFPAIDGRNAYDIMRENSFRHWKRLLKSSEVPFRVLALRKIFEQIGGESAELLLDVYMRDNSFNVRLEALKLLASLRSEEFRKILQISVKDQNEMIRKFSAMWMGKIGDVKYAEALIERAIHDNSSRVRRVALEALEVIPYKEVLNVVDRNRLPGDEAKEKLKRSLDRNFEWLNNELLPVLRDKQKPVKDRLGAIRTFRNYNFVDAVDPLLNVAVDENEIPEIRVSAIEALGWFQYSKERQRIIEALEICLQKARVERVKSELLKTINRLRSGPNNPLTP